MRPMTVLMLMVHHAGGKVCGRTLLQKRGYFVERLVDLDLDYAPHYYGPFSARLDMAIGRAKALEFVTERAVPLGIEGFGGMDARRFDYELTPDGEVVLEEAMAREKEMTRTIIDVLQCIREAGDQDYMKLAIASKIDFLLQTAGTGALAEATEACHAWGWEIRDGMAEEALLFLQAIGLWSWCPSASASRSLPNA